MSQSGTSVLASLVFVALFVLLISSYRLITPSSLPSQSAAVLSALSEGEEVVAVPETCNAGDVFTVNVEGNHSSISQLRCYVSDPETGALMPGPDISKPGCAITDTKSCIVRYCPPSSMVTRSGMCIQFAQCDPAAQSSCLRGVVQNMLAPVQAANILAARLIDLGGATQAESSDGAVSVALASILTPSAAREIAAVIEATGQAAGDTRVNAFKDLAESIVDAGVDTGIDPVAALSCQPMSVDPGMKITIAYGCAQAQLIATRGFSTNGRLWGATEEEIASTTGSGSRRFSLTCSNGNRIDTASCEVGIEKPFLLTATNPAGPNGLATFSWLSRGVDSCTMTTDNPRYERALAVAPGSAGVIRFFPARIDTNITMECVTRGGHVIRASERVPKVN